MRKIDLDSMKQEYIGKTFNWLTVLDVYKNTDKGRVFFKCKCRCGNEVDLQYNKVISGHNKSCGCYRHSTEFSDSLCEYWKSNPDKVKEKTDKCKQWIKNNADKVVERGKKHSQFYKDHRDIVDLQKEKRAKTLESNPQIQQDINTKIKQCWDEDKRSSFSEYKKQFYTEHPETSQKISDSITKFYRENPEKKQELSDKIIKFREENPDEVSRQIELHKQWFKNNRLRVIEQSAHLSSLIEDKRSMQIADACNNSDEFSILLNAVHPSIKDDLLSGKIKVYDTILTKCPCCGSYSEHTFGNIWRLYDSKFRTGSLPMCEKCRYSITSSKYEQDIEDCIASFYSGECIKNSRTVISPLELDLYYPEKKIAIEFNGDYWHDENHKPKDYHYNKFKLCYDNGITLVSIFENDWISLREELLLYLHDLFTGTKNKLSYIDTNTINLNYPPPALDLSQYTIHDNFYSNKDIKVFTCGYAVKQQCKELSFLEETASKYNLECFINDKHDLEIRDRNLCFHYADLLSGELDAYSRWEDYHNRDIRCVFIYPPDLLNENKKNIYKNILTYHCGFANRIYARNTEVKVYPAIKMRQFFETNNIAGYRNATTAYVLEDKKTHEPLMCYLIGHAYFGKGKYDCEIARGACKMGISVVGGASKLWKHIINSNPEIKSIVYYCDRRQYDQRSINHLMDSNAMTGLGHVYMLNGGPSFLNYWINDTYVENKIWHHAGEFTNREPHRHKLVMNEIHSGNCISVYNPGSFVNIFVRAGWHLEDTKVVKDSV